MISRCYKEDVFIPRIEKALQIQMPSYRCHVVDQTGMTKVMKGAGWNKKDTHGVVGFHVDENVYVLKSAKWTTLHELIHRAGVNADRINRHLAEGLTELIASELKEGKDEHRPTYPRERVWVEKFLKKLKMSPLELGQLITHSSNPPRTVAELVVDRGLSKKTVAAVTRSLAAQQKNAPSFNRSPPTNPHGHIVAVHRKPDYPVYLFLVAFGLGAAALMRRRGQHA